MPYLKLNYQIGKGHKQMNLNRSRTNELDRSRTNESEQVTTCPYSVTIVTQNLILYLYLCLTQFNNN